MLKQGRAEVECTSDFFCVFLEFDFHLRATRAIYFVELVFDV